MKYKPKQVIVDAFQWIGGPDQKEDPEWMVEAIKNAKAFFLDGAMYVQTVEGTMRCDCGDYVIKGVLGDLHVLNQIEFKHLYEVVE